MSLKPDKIWPPPRDKQAKDSKFLDSLYNNPEKYKKIKKVVNDMMSEASALKIERAKYSNYVFPLGFDIPMLLSEVEEKAIGAAVLSMSRLINEHKYTILDGAELVRFEVSDHNQKDVPIPYIKLHIKCLKEIAPVHGFYFRGIFEKEKILKEIIKAKITKIVYLTESKEEKVLLSF